MKFPSLAAGPLGPRGDTRSSKMEALRSPSQTALLRCPLREGVEQAFLGEDRDILDKGESPALASGLPS